MTDDTITAWLTAWGETPDTALPLRISRLRQAQALLTIEAATDITTSPDAGHWAAVLAALDQADANPSDAREAYATVLQKLRVLVDVELSRWTSARVQPMGPSGEIAVAAP